MLSWNGYVLTAKSPDEKERKDAQHTLKGGKEF